MIAADRHVISQTTCWERKSSFEMSRRIEITVPNHDGWNSVVREILSKEEGGCNFSDKSARPHMMVESACGDKTMFFITVPGAAVTGILEVLRQNGVGEFVGRVLLSPVEYVKPTLDMPLFVEAKKRKAPVKKLQGLAHFKLARKTTEELYMEISTNTSLRINTYMNLIGASLMAAGGLATGLSVYVVASMLVSPIMGPILGITLGYRVNNYKLFRKGVINEFKMAICAWMCGVVYALVLGHLNTDSDKWPLDATVPIASQYFNLYITGLVSAAAGVVLGVSLTSVTPNALVGTAISAGLLPPIVNCGMLTAYAWSYAPLKQKADLYELANYNFLFYFTHMIIIIFVANLVFWLKDVNPKFKEKEDANFDDIPTLANHNSKLRQQGMKHGSITAEGDKAMGFMKMAFQDIKSTVVDTLDKTKDVGKDIMSGDILKKSKEKKGADKGGAKKKYNALSSIMTLVDDDDDDIIGGDVEEEGDVESQDVKKETKVVKKVKKGLQKKDKKLKKATKSDNGETSLSEEHADSELSTIEV